ncbi:MAG TPA: hypothetical protein O0X70_07500, partial [Methanocorpusculum sp.]|nr:hypothetical protein [Methanocorpusculum sp.]
MRRWTDYPLLREREGFLALYLSAPDVRDFERLYGFTFRQYRLAYEYHMRRMPAAVWLAARREMLKNRERKRKKTG